MILLQSRNKRIRRQNAIPRDSAAIQSAETFLLLSAKRFQRWTFFPDISRHGLREAEAEDGGQSEGEASVPRPGLPPAGQQAERRGATV